MKCTICHEPGELLFNGFSFCEKHLDSYATSVKTEGIKPYVAWEALRKAWRLEESKLVHEKLRQREKEAEAAGIDLRSLNIADRFVNPFRRFFNGGSPVIVTIPELAALTDHELYLYTGVGKKTVEKVKRALTEWEQGGTAKGTMTKYESLAAKIAPGLWAKSDWQRKYHYFFGESGPRGNMNTACGSVVYRPDKLSSIAPESSEQCSVCVKVLSLVEIQPEAEPP